MLSSFVRLRSHLRHLARHRSQRRSSGPALRALRVPRRRRRNPRRSAKAGPPTVASRGVDPTGACTGNPQLWSVASGLMLRDGRRAKLTQITRGSAENRRIVPADALASSAPTANDRLVEVVDGYQQRSTATASMSNVSRATLWSATPSASRRCMSRRVGNTNPSNVFGSCVYWAIGGLPVTSGE
jgi:hypothetical protein